MTVEPMWPASWPAAQQIYAALPIQRPINDITAAGELLARAGENPDWLQFFQVVHISGYSAADTARMLLELGDNDRPVTV